VKSRLTSSCGYVEDEKWWDRYGRNEWEFFTFVFVFAYSVFFFFLIFCEELKLGIDQSSHKCRAVSIGVALGLL